MPVSSALQLADLALTWDEALGNADLSILDLDLASDRGLLTAVILSLCTDRRAEDDDKPPSEDARDRRGWWADQFNDVEGDRYGSRRWLLDRAKMTRETVLREEEYDREALQWMIDDRVISSIDVMIETTTSAIYVQIDLQRPGRDPVSFRFAPAWDHLQEDI